MKSDDPLLEDEPTIDVGGILPELAVSAGGPMMLGGRYVLLGMVGAGAMGTVYRARDIELGEIVAVKMLRRELSQNPTFVARFRQEVKLARRVTHRNVARTFDIGEQGGDRFITMEYVEGEPLSDRMLRVGRISLGEALDIAGSVCAGLAAAHAAGVVHRDLKPENILLARDNRVVLTDFGVALPFEDDEGDTVVDGGIGLIGTPIYMAPEQVEGSDVDLRADLYALGAILFEMLTGERPWKGETAWAVASARLSAPPPDPRHFVPDLPEAVSRAVGKLMARHPYDRFANAIDVVTELSTITLPSSPGSMRGSRMSLPSIPDLPLDASSKAVAVLGFLPGHDSDEAWALGVARVIADRLRSIEGLRVLTPGAPPSSERDVRALGQRAGAHAVVDGVLRRSNGRVAIGARLTAVVDGFQLWAARLERPEAEGLEVAGELVQGVAQALTVDRGLKPERASVDVRAVGAYLEGRAALADDPAAAAAAFRRALAVAPDDPSIGAALARAELAEAFATDTVSLDLARAAVAHARAALAVQADLAEAR
ncbi:MAG TPA: serine/threonine-protein kinase, partial [Polyangiaceae bacterium]|nr:serine/threonine-protein kinase [Polyangiaceae bacterium]